MPGLEQRAAHTRAAVRCQGFFLRRLGVAGNPEKQNLRAKSADRAKVSLTSSGLRAGQPGQQHGQRAAAECIRLASLGRDRLDPGPFGLAEHLPSWPFSASASERSGRISVSTKKFCSTVSMPPMWSAMGVGHNDIVELPHPGRTQRGGEANRPNPAYRRRSGNTRLPQLTRTLSPWADVEKNVTAASPCASISALGPSTRHNRTIRAAGPRWAGRRGRPRASMR